MAAEPLTADAVLERFRYLNQFIEGVKRSIKNPPSKPIGDNDYPYVYGLAGDLLQPVTIASGRITEVRQFGHRLMLMPMKDGLDSVEEGSEANIRGVPFLSRWIDFYVARPKLQHDGIEGHATNIGVQALAGCELVSMTGSGIKPLPAGDNITCAGIEFLFVVTMSRLVRTVSSPYPEV